MGHSPLLLYVFKRSECARRVVFSQLADEERAGGHEHPSKGDPVDFSDGPGVFGGKHAAARAAERVGLAAVLAGRPPSGYGPRSVG